MSRRYRIDFDFQALDNVLVVTDTQLQKIDAVGDVVSVNGVVFRAKDGIVHAETDSLPVVSRKKGI